MSSSNVYLPWNLKLSGKYREYILQTVGSLTIYFFVLFSHCFPISYFRSIWSFFYKYTFSILHPLPPIMKPSLNLILSTCIFYCTFKNYASCIFMNCTQYYFECFQVYLSIISLLLSCLPVICLWDFLMLRCAALVHSSLPLSLTPLYECIHPF